MKFQNRILRDWVLPIHILHMILVSDFFLFYFWKRWGSKNRREEIPGVRKWKVESFGKIILKGEEHLECLTSWWSSRFSFKFQGPSSAKANVGIRKDTVIKHPKAPNHRNPSLQFVGYSHSDLDAPLLSKNLPRKRWRKSCFRIFYFFCVSAECSVQQQVLQLQLDFIFVLLIFPGT